MRKITTFFIITLFSSLAFAEGKWEISIIEMPDQDFKEFISTEGFGYKTSKDAVENVCGDSQFAPLKIAIHEQDKPNIAVYTCDAWRAGNHEPEIRKFMI